MTKLVSGAVYKGRIDKHKKEFSRFVTEVGKLLNEKTAPKEREIAISSINSMERFGFVNDNGFCEAIFQLNADIESVISSPIAKVFPKHTPRYNDFQSWKLVLQSMKEVKKITRRNKRKVPQNAKKDLEMEIMILAFHLARTHDEKTASFETRLKKSCMKAVNIINEKYRGVAKVRPDDARIGAKIAALMDKKNLDINQYSEQLSKLLNCGNRKYILNTILQANAALRGRVESGIDELFYSINKKEESPIALKLYDRFSKDEINSGIFDLKNAISKMDELDRRIIELKFGLNSDGEEKSFKDISMEIYGKNDTYNIKKISQRYSRILLRLKSALGKS